MKIEISNTLDVPRQKFDHLVSNSASVHNLSYDLIIAFWNHFKNGGNNKRIGQLLNLNIVKIYRNDILSTIIPLVLVKRKKFRFFQIKQLEILTQQFGGPFLSFIGENITKYEFIEIIKSLKKKFSYDFLEWTYLPKYDFLSDEILPHSHSLLVKLDSYKNYAEYSDAVYDKKFKKNIDRRRKLFFNDDGGIIVKKFNDLSNEELAEIRGIGSTKSIDSQKNDILLKDDYWSYLIKIFGIVDDRVMIAKLNGKIVGYHLTYKVQNGLRIFSMLAYHRGFKKYGIGNLIDDEEIRVTNFEKETIISMGPGVSDYKTKFANCFTRRYILFQKGNTLKSLLFYPIIYRKLKSNSQTIDRQTNNLNHGGLYDETFFKDI